VDVLRRTALFVTHGGFNSVHEALWFGVPMVVVPQGHDQPWIARRLADLGAGLLLPRRGARPGTLHRAVRHVLDSPG
jgi:UDP:flavonoid glycosyltransferase YjiC (YdhE family)